MLCQIKIIKEEIGPLPCAVLKKMNLRETMYQKHNRNAAYVQTRIIKDTETEQVGGGVPGPARCLSD